MTVLCVDDHPILLRGLEENVRLAVPGADIHGFANSRDALSYAEEHGCDVLLTEIELYNHGGMRLAEQIKALFPRANIIFVTVCSEKEHAKEVLRLRPSGYLTKPATREQIAEELRNLRYSVPDASPGLRRPAAAAPSASTAVPLHRNDDDRFRAKLMKGPNKEVIR